MITLTNAKLVNSVLGGTDTVAYNKMILTDINYDVQKLTATALVRIMSTTEPTMQDITGTLRIDTASSTLTISVGQVDFYRQITLTTGQKNAVIGYIQSTQDDLEAGLVAIGVVAGTQSTGA